MRPASDLPGVPRAEVSAAEINDDGSNERICFSLSLAITNPINFSRRDFKCKDTVVSLYDLVGGNLEVKLTGNKSYLGLPNRTLGMCEQTFALVPD